ncbi:hypothetical protein PG996_008377 [Apiospora saccharicola]|uniref:Uncharacterized protein n=1 Tax=Apiospora saccharicola TaxID=335842 RepID=A0ABR1V095_9PEZI
MSTNYQPVDDYSSHYNHAQGDEHFNRSHLTDNDPAHKPSMSATYWPVDGQGSTYQYPHDNNQSRTTIYADNVPMHNLPGYDQLGDTRSGPANVGEIPGDHRQPPAPKGRKIPSLWMWELLASAFSLICIAVVVVVLLNEDGKPLSGWALMISPNAVISFITTLAKSSCLLVLAEVIGQLRWVHFATAPRTLTDIQLFDAGSRGPWGALQLMFRMKTTALLASAASVLTIAALVIDPFAQLVFSFPTRETPSLTGSRASINLAHVYDANTSVTQNHGPPYPVAQNAPFQLQSAVISAAFGVNPNFELTCPTSNCTFPPVSTLGICSTCEDVVDRTNTVCAQNKGSGATVCNTTVPRQLLPPSNFTWSVASDAAGQYANVWNSSSAAVTPEMVTVLTGYGQPAVLAAFTALKLDRSLFRSSDRPTKPSQVNQCMLAYCLKTYNNITVHNSKTNIGPIDEQIMHISSHEFFRDPPQTGNYLFTMQAYADGKTSGPNYTMNWFDHLNLGRYMYDVFNSTVGLSVGTYGPGDGGKMAPSFGLAMYNADNLTTMVGQIADSMTNSMRNNQNNVTSAEGITFANETFIHIEWKWLALPVSVSVLSFVLLIAVMINSKRHGVQVWKSSSLPLLFYGLEGWDKEHTRGFESPHDLHKRSKAMKGQVNLDSEHPVFLKDGLFRTDDPTQ